MNSIILASQSPRRKDLLSRMGVEFEVMPSDIPEPLDQSRDPRKNAMELALAKASHIAEQFPDAIVIGSDSIVTAEGIQLAKPESLREARQMLFSLSQAPSSVVTGIVVVCKSRSIQLVDVEVSYVYFKPDSPKVTELREQYLVTGDWSDKAGGYGIQSGAAPLISHIQGNYDTIVGLPTVTLTRMLKEVGVMARPVKDDAPVPIR